MFVNHRTREGFYLDVTKAPLQDHHFFILLNMLKNARYKYFFINFGEYFPWSEDFHFQSVLSYSEQMLEKLDEKSVLQKIDIIPVLSVFGENDFIIKEKHYRHFSPDFPENREIDCNAVGLILFYEEMIDDLFSVFIHSSTVCLDMQGISRTMVFEFVSRITRVLSEKNRKVIFQNLPVDVSRDIDGPLLHTLDSDIQQEELCWREKMYALSQSPRLVVVRGEAVFDFIPFCCMKEMLSAHSLESESNGKNCFFSCTLLREFYEYQRTCWNWYRTISEKFSLLFMERNSSSVVSLFEMFDEFEKSYRVFMKKSEQCMDYFAHDFKYNYIRSFFYSKTEPLEIFFHDAAFRMEQIKRRVL